MIHKIVIFGGTSEGRELAEWSADQGFSTVVSVATPYGRQVVADRPNLVIRVGRLDREHMKELLLMEIPDLIVDATHPHAVEVTQTIRQAAADCGLPCIRVIREEFPVDPESCGEENVLRVPSVHEAVQILGQENGAVFVTTGSKELREFTRYPGLKERIFARVLPDSRVLADCEELGIRGKHLIAMQGPFSTEINLAMLRMTNAKWMVTKESGINGGFYEKIEAARQCDVRTIVIERSEHEKGLTVAELKSRILWLAGKSRHLSRRVSLIGMGMGGGQQLTLEAQKALLSSEVIFGAPRMLRDIASYVPGRLMIPFYKGKDIFDYLEEHPQRYTASVVYSGDTGYHSGCSGFLREFPKRGGNYSVCVFPGISTFSCLCARFQIRGETVFAASIHGQEEDIVSLLRNYGRVFLLLDRTHTISSVCRELSEAGYGRTQIFAGIRLGYPDEQLIRDRADRLTQEESDPLAAMIMEREDIIDAG
ncbi:MAG: precorrin-6A reductase [Clostridiales bacterium]|nr:precorrin-6A reductase [Clostridiales bacterium]